MWAVFRMVSPGRGKVGIPAGVVIRDGWPLVVSTACTPTFPCTCETILFLLSVEVPLLSWCKVTVDATSLQVFANENLYTCKIVLRSITLHDGQIQTKKEAKTVWLNAIVQTITAFHVPLIVIPPKIGENPRAASTSASTKGLGGEKHSCCSPAALINFYYSVLACSPPPPFVPKLPAPSQGLDFWC